MSTHSGWIGVDLDGTLAHYDHWRGETHIGSPIPRMVARVKDWLSQGQDVRIFTARVSSEPTNKDGTAHDAGRVTMAIQDWCRANIGRCLPITNRKDYRMIELWDDRAVQVVPNTGLSIAESLQ